MKRSYSLRPSAPVSRIDYAAELNEQQLAAVQAEDGAHLVIAGAGTGKTRVLTYRVARLLETGVAPEAILLLTFSRKASKEMMRRAADLGDPRAERVAGGTFHHFAHRLLRRFHREVGLPERFNILDRGDSEDLLHHLRGKLRLGEGEERFPQKRTIASIHGQAANTERTVSKILREEWPHFSHFEDEIASLLEAYRLTKLKQGLVDYDDLLRFLADILEGPSGEAAASAWRHVLVDEFQDTNRLQLRILRALVKPHGNLMAVGDDFQSIYGFRGAEVKNLLDFPEHFPGARIHKIEENYRSAETILDFSNRILQAAPRKFDKKLFSRRPGGEKPILLSPMNESQQSAFVVQRIKEHLDADVALSEMAVLVRSGNHSNDLEVALARAGIPFRKYGGIRFAEASHVKDLLAHARLVAQPLDATAWTRSLQLLPGIGAGTAAKYVEAATEQGRGLDALADEALRPKRAAKAIAVLHELLLRLQGESAAKTIRELVEYLEPILEEKYDDWRKRREDLRTLVDLADRAESLENYLADLSLDPLEAREDDQDASNEDHLTVSTIHSAKGLEWRCVFLISLAEGCLPSMPSLDDPDAIEEERRLFYVAVTRAKRELYLIAPRLERPGRGWETPLVPAPSRFLTELPDLENSVDIWTLE